MSSQPINTPAAVYVYELPVRLWHSVNALAIVVLAITGYLIANPLASVGGPLPHGLYSFYPFCRRLFINYRLIVSRVLGLCG